MFLYVGIQAHLDPNLIDDAQRTAEDMLGKSLSTHGFMAGGVLGGIIILISYLYVAFVVRAIVKTTVNGNPFVTENISRLRKTWIIIILAEIVRIIAIGIFDQNDTSSAEGMGLELSYQAWFLAFFIAIMAEVFRIGLELRRDQELTV